MSQNRPMAGTAPSAVIRGSTPRFWLIVLEFRWQLKIGLEILSQPTSRMEALVLDIGPLRLSIEREVFPGHRGWALPGFDAMWTWSTGGRVKANAGR